MVMERFGQKVRTANREVMNTLKSWADKQTAVIDSN